MDFAYIRSFNKILYRTAKEKIYVCTENVIIQAVDEDEELQNE